MIYFVVFIIISLIGSYYSIYSSLKEGDEFKLIHLVGGLFDGLSGIGFILFFRMLHTLFSEKVIFKKKRFLSQDEKIEKELNEVRELLKKV